MRTSSVILLAAALLVSACDSKPADKPADQAADKPTDKPADKPAGAAASPPAGAQAERPSSRVATPAPAPAWFDPERIPHVAITKQMASQAAVGDGGQATAMILELEDGVTPAQCIERATAAIGSEVPDIPEPSEADGRLTIQGKTDAYSYTVVCGDANGKPSMYLAFNA
jgi:hypothetical protein